MSEAKQLLSEKIVAPQITNNAVTETIGVVMKADEKENVCDVAYINSAGKWERKSNIPYEVQHEKDDYFPKPQSKIRLKESNDNQPIIKGALLDYVKDVKPKRIYKKDVMPNNRYVVRGKVSP